MRVHREQFEGTYMTGPLLLAQAGEITIMF